MTPLAQHAFQPIRNSVTIVLTHPLGKISHLLVQIQTFNINFGFVSVDISVIRMKVCVLLIFVCVCVCVCVCWEEGGEGGGVGEW